MPEPTPTPDHEQDLYVVFQAAGQPYALPHHAVVEMVQPPPVVPIPGTGSAVRGVVNLRGHVLGLLDLRRALGLPSAQAENQKLLSELAQREKEHRAWLAELEAAVREERDFQLTLDPHACAFGRWFDGFETQQVMLAQVVERMGPPHLRIHAVASTVMEASRAGDKERALQIIETTRHGDLAQLIELFGETRDVLVSMQREIAVVVQAPEQGNIALLVDSVEAIDTLEPQTGEDAYASASPLLQGVATNRGDELVLLLDPGELVSQFQQRNVA